MRALVTGGAGFIGSHLADALLNKNYQVEIIDNLSTGDMANVPAEAVFHQADIGSPEIEKMFEKGRFDIMFHLAAQMDVRKSVADPVHDAKTNILGGINLLQACKKYGVKKVVFSSTGGAVYGEQSQFPAPESHPVNPLSPYGISKLTFEKYLYFYKHEFGLDYVVLRYANVYGPRQRSDGEAGVVAIFFNRFLSGKQAVVFGDGKQTRDFVYVGDVVKANLLAVDYNKCDIFNVGTGKETDINTLFNMVRELCGSDQKHVWQPALPGEQKRSVIDSALIKKELGWDQSYDLKKGLQETSKYFKERIKQI
jgi:UDP-glucose 4-epimerase